MPRRVFAPALATSVLATTTFITSALGLGLMLPTAASAEGTKPIWGWTSPAAYQTATGKAIAGFNESPMSADLVKAGKLPALAERLPADPVVDNPFHEVGRYGGQLTMPQVSDSTGFPASNFTTFEPVLSLARDGLQVVPNIAESFSFSADSKTLTVKLRKGMKWSDGQPFTAADFTFFWNDIENNPDLTQSPRSLYRPGGTSMKISAPDDETVVFDFAVPYTAMASVLSGILFNGVQGEIFEASHYMKQFHKTYNPDANKLAKSQGFDDWVQMFNAKRYRWYRATPDVPTVGPWAVTQKNAESTILTRNQYYFKVDTAGNQLPYIDQVVATNFGDTANLAVKMAAGQYDYADWGTSIADYPAFQAGAPAGDFHTWLAPSAWTSIAAYSVNQNFAGDPADADILRNVKFREALSLSLNRDEINEIVALGQGTPMQATINPGASFYKEEWGKYLIDQNVDQANKLLDEAGLDKRDSDGLRLRPDGKPFTLIISNVPDAVPAKIGELVSADWQAVGIRTQLKDTDRNLMGEQFTSGQFMIAGWAMDGVSEPAIAMGGSNYLANGQQWGWSWGQWISTGGKTGTEPPADAKDLIETYRKASTLPPDEQKAALVHVFDLWEKGLYRVGTIGLVPKPAVTKNKLGNVDEATYTDNAEFGIGFFNRHYQFYWKQ